MAFERRFISVVFFARFARIAAASRPAFARVNKLAVAAIGEARSRTQVPEKSALGEGHRVIVQIEPFLIASTVNTVIGQRLVRRISDKKDSVTSSELETKSIQETLGGLLPKTREDVARASEDIGYKDLPLATDSTYTLAKGKDSAQSPGGYKGRVGLYEVMDISDAIQGLIIKHATSSEIQRQAVAEGMITMRQDGYLKALQGLTTLDEVNRVAANMA